MRISKNYEFLRISSLFKISLMIKILLVYGTSGYQNDDDILSKLRPLKYPNTGKCEEFCGSITCETIKKCDKGVILKNESYCNCCDACVEYLDVGENCSKFITGTLSLGAQTRCIPGTTCSSDTDKCELNRDIPSCLRQRDIRREHRKGNYSENIWIPQCDKEGNYLAKQKKIKKSICFDELGNKIFGDAQDSLENTCACSRYMQKKENKRKSDGVVPNGESQEHCTPSGSFEHLQCINNLCYCADENDGLVKSPVVRIEYLDKLSCYDSKLYKEGYLRNCETELQRTRKLTYEFWQKNVILKELDQVKCDPDGSFSPVQRQANEYICTDKEGNGISSYKIAVYDAVNTKITCNCARDELSTLLNSPNECSGHGEYMEFRCSDDICVCLDNDGDSISKEIVKSEDIKKDCKNLLKKLSDYPNDEKPVDNGDDDLPVEGGGDDDDDDYYNYIDSN